MRVEKSNSHRQCAECKVFKKPFCIEPSSNFILARDITKKPVTAAYVLIFHSVFIIFNISKREIYGEECNQIK